MPFCIRRDISGTYLAGHGSMVQWIVPVPLVGPIQGYGLEDLWSGSRNSSSKKSEFGNDSIG